MQIYENRICELRLKKTNMEAILAVMNTTKVVVKIIFLLAAQG